MEKASTGKIVTLMSVDTERICIFLSYMHDVGLRIPVSIIISVTGLILVLGWPALVGILVTIVMGTISLLLGKYIIKLQGKLLKSTDARVSVMNEILQGIRIVKYFAWEGYFTKKVSEARKKELESLIKLWSGQIWFSTIGSGSGVIIAFSTFAMYTLVAGKTLDTASAFTAISLLKVVSQLLTSLPNHVMMMFNAMVSFDRISTFLEEEEIEKHSLGPSVGDYIGFSNASCVYYGTGVGNPDSSFGLRNLNIKFPKSQLTLITGVAASGKTSLILSLLGGMV